MGSVSELKESMELRTQKTKAFFWWTATAFYMLLIFALSSQSRIPVTILPEGSDKVVHLLVYIVLALLLYSSFTKSGRGKHVFLLAFTIASLYGVSDEIHQSFVPGRDASLGDVIADTTGALVGSFYMKIRRS